jgi:type II secretory pathway pseudopilin PulG
MKDPEPNQPKRWLNIGEILIVIIIMFVLLVCLLFAGASRAMIINKLSKVLSTAYNVRNAASTYYTEYRTFPLPEGVSGSEYVDFPTDEKFMDIL